MIKLCGTWKTAELGAVGKSWACQMDSASQTWILPAVFLGKTNFQALEFVLGNNR